MTPEQAAERAAEVLDEARKSGIDERVAALVQVADGWTRLHTALANAPLTSHRPSGLTTAEELAKMSEAYREKLASIAKVIEVRDTQGRPGNWDADEYMRGLYNGLELAVSILEGEREPDFRSEPASGYRKPKIVLNAGSAPFTDEERG